MSALEYEWKHATDRRRREERQERCANPPRTRPMTKTAATIYRRRIRRKAANAGVPIPGSRVSFELDPDPNTHGGTEASFRAINSPFPRLRMRLCGEDADPGNTARLPLNAAACSPTTYKRTMVPSMCADQTPQLHPACLSQLLQSGPVRLTPWTSPSRNSTCAIWAPSR